MIPRIPLSFLRILNIFKPGCQGDLKSRASCEDEIFQQTKMYLSFSLDLPPVLGIRTRCSLPGTGKGPGQLTIEGKKIRVEVARTDEALGLMFEDKLALMKECFSLRTRGFPFLLDEKYSPPPLHRFPRPAGEDRGHSGHGAFQPANPHLGPARVVRIGNESGVVQEEWNPGGGRRENATFSHKIVSSFGFRVSGFYPFLVAGYSFSVSLCSLFPFHPSPWS
jgi:hypothetical protein